MEDIRFELRCAQLLFDKGIKFHNNRDYQRAIDMFNMSLAICPANVRAWINICQCKKELGVEHQKYLDIMSDMSLKGHVEISQFISGEAAMEDYAPDKPYAIPEELRDSIVSWHHQDFIDDVDIMDVFAQSFFEEVFPDAAS